jgi:hypothetical protein
MTSTPELGRPRRNAKLVRRRVTSTPPPFSQLLPPLDLPCLAQDATLRLHLAQPDCPRIAQHRVVDHRQPADNPTPAESLIPVENPTPTLTREELESRLQETLQLLDQAASRRKNSPGSLGGEGHGYLSCDANPNVSAISAP